jgi:hypothetical protein
LSFLIYHFVRQQKPKTWFRLRRLKGFFGLVVFNFFYSNQFEKQRLQREEWRIYLSMKQAKMYICDVLQETKTSYVGKQSK